MEGHDHLEGSFYQYLHQVGEADPEWNQDVLRSYIPYFTECDRVLDVGCGHGGFIQVLESAGVEGVGVDADRMMVEVCREKGLHVVEADLFDYLPKQKEQFDGIFSSNLIEHLSAEDAVRFVQLAYEALRPGGRFLVTTPNPASLIVQLREFWRDATHVRLYDGSLLEFMLDWAGFAEVRSVENSTTSWEPPSGLQAVPELMEELALLRREIQWRSRIEQPTSHNVEQSLLRAGMAREAESGGEVRESKGAISWAERTAELVNKDHERSLLRRVISSIRRRVARFLVDTVLFEEFAALNELSSTLNRTSTELTRELVRVNDSLRTKFLKLIELSVTAQRIEQAMYQDQYALLVTPREVFAIGEKPVVEFEAAE